MRPGIATPAYKDLSDMSVGDSRDEMPSAFKDIAGLVGLATQRVRELRSILYRKVA